MRARLATALLLTTFLPAPGAAVGQHDLAVIGFRLPRKVMLTDRRVVRTQRAAVKIENRGSDPVLFPDAATLLDVVDVTGTDAAGAIVCPAVTARPVVRPSQRFPLPLYPGRRLTIPFELTFTCAADPVSSWTATARVDRAAVDGNPDANPADDVCPRAPLGQVGAVLDRGCGPLGPGHRPVTVSLTDSRASTRFALAGPFAVGRTTLALVDTSRPTMPNGTFAGAPERTLPTIVWYPAPGVGGIDAPLAPAGAPYPLIVFAHGLGSFPDQSVFLMSHLASHGYIVAAPRFPLSSIGAPGGQTLADKPGEAGDVSFLIDTFTSLAATPANRFTGGVDLARVGLTGHSNGGLITLVTTYDSVLRDPRIKAAIPMSPPACFLQPGYYGAVDVPLFLLHGNRDLLVDYLSHGQAAYDRTNPPKSFILIDRGNHLGFSDFGELVDDLTGCGFLPPPATLVGQIAMLIDQLGGAANFVGLTGCAVTACAGDPAHILPARQRQIAKTAVVAFLESILRADATGAAYLADDLAPTNPDLTYQHTP